jgi:hypothetical protein
MNFQLEKTEKELNAEILDLTMQIGEACPELSKYIAEMPVEISHKTEPGSCMKDLEAYIDSLYAIYNRYVQHHPTCGQSKQSVL